MSCDPCGDAAASLGAWPAQVLADVRLIAFNVAAGELHFAEGEREFPLVLDADNEPVFDGFSCPALDLAPWRQLVWGLGRVVAFGAFVAAPGGSFSHRLGNLVSDAGLSLQIQLHTGSGWALATQDGADDVALKYLPPKTWLRVPAKGDPHLLFRGMYPFPDRAEAIAKDPPGSRLVFFRISRRDGPAPAAEASPAPKRHKSAAKEAQTAADDGPPAPSAAAVDKSARRRERRRLQRLAKSAAGETTELKADEADDESAPPAPPAARAAKGAETDAAQKKAEAQRQKEARAAEALAKKEEAQRLKEARAAEALAKKEEAQRLKEARAAEALAKKEEAQRQKDEKKRAEEAKKLAKQASGKSKARPRPPAPAAKAGAATETEPEEADFTDDDAAPVTDDPYDTGAGVGPEHPWAGEDEPLAEGGEPVVAGRFDLRGMVCAAVERKDHPRSVTHPTPPLIFRDGALRLSGLGGVVLNNPLNAAYLLTTLPRQGTAEAAEFLSSVEAVVEADTHNTGPPEAVVERALRPAVYAVGQNLYTWYIRNWPVHCKVRVMAVVASERLLLSEHVSCHQFPAPPKAGGLTELALAGLEAVRSLDCAMGHLDYAVPMAAALVELAAMVATAEETTGPQPPDADVVYGRFAARVFDRWLKEMDSLLCDRDYTQLWGAVVNDRTREQQVFALGSVYASLIKVIFAARAMPRKPAVRAAGLGGGARRGRPAPRPTPEMEAANRRVHMQLVDLAAAQEVESETATDTSSSSSESETEDGGEMEAYLDARMTRNFPLVSMASRTGFGEGAPPTPLLLGGAGPAPPAGSPRAPPGSGPSSLASPTASPSRHQLVPKAVMLTAVVDMAHHEGVSRLVRNFLDVAAGSAAPGKTSFGTLPCGTIKYIHARGCGSIYTFSDHLARFPPRSVFDLDGRPWSPADHDCADRNPARVVIVTTRFAWVAEDIFTPPVSLPGTPGSLVDFIKVDTFPLNSAVPLGPRWD